MIRMRRYIQRKGRGRRNQKKGREGKRAARRIEVFILKEGRFKLKAEELDTIYS